MSEKTLDVWSGQRWQIIFGLIVIFLFAIFGPPKVPEGQFPKEMLGAGVVFWYWIAILLPIVHQAVIAPLWKLELSSQKLTSMFGSTDRAFLLFKIVFALFFIPRLFIVIPLAWLTRDTLDPASGFAFLIIGIVLTPIALYGMYSVIRYFGINRAFGGDHFYPSYREMPMVREGIYKYTSNAMYIIVLSIVWIPAAWFGSIPGLIVGIFNHLFVWVHYYLIEEPDIEYIYS